MRPITAIILVALVAGPWYTWVGMRTQGTWLASFLGQHNLGRAMSPMEGHGGPFYYYIVALLIGFFPWSVLTLPTSIEVVRGVRRRDESRNAILFLSCWVGVFVVLFTIAQTKLPSYVVPAYPAVAILFGAYVVRWSQAIQQSSEIWPSIGMGILAIVGVVVFIGLAWAGQVYLHGDWIVGLVGMIPMIGGVAGLLCVLRAHSTAAGRILLATAVVQSLVIYGFVSLRVDRHRQEDELFSRIERSEGETRVASFGRLEPSWVFYLGKPIQPFAGNRPEQVFGFIAEHDSAYVITTEKGAATLLDTSPTAMEIVASVPYFLRGDKVVMLAPRVDSISTKAKASSTGMAR